MTNSGGLIISKIGADQVLSRSTITPWYYVYYMNVQIFLGRAVGTFFCICCNSQSYQSVSEHRFVTNCMLFRVLLTYLKLSNTPHFRAENEQKMIEEAEKKKQIEEENKKKGMHSLLV